MIPNISSIPLLTSAEEVTLARAIEAGLYAEHLLVAGCPDYATTSELWAVRAEGKAAWTEFFQANLRLAAHIANRWAIRFRMETDDILQECCLALGSALMSWDWARGTRFSTLAWPRMMFAAESACWQRRSGGQSSVWWMRAKSAERRAWSPPRPLTERDETASRVDRDDRTAIIKGRLAQLDDRGRIVIERRFGLRDTSTTYTQLAKDLDVSPRTVKRMEERALAAMAADRELVAA
ncbi:MAG: sigma-70 family RNA polymerase sigma factor [Propionibacteriaceae bacterium]|nr:sigma-70 family RNA polymerase sigma factor [Propionibacteriaceae bacterium]